MREPSQSRHQTVLSGEFTVSGRIGNRFENLAYGGKKTRYGHMSTENVAGHKTAVLVIKKLFIALVKNNIL